MKSLAVLAAILATAGMASAQYQAFVPPCSDTMLNGVSSSGNVFNLTNATNARVQHIYDSSMFPQDPAGITITDISIRGVCFAGCATFSGPGGVYGDVEIYMGTITNMSAATTTFATNYTTGPVQCRDGAYATGPVSVGPTNGAWIPLGLTTSYTYFPCLGQDLVIEIRKCGQTAGMGVSADCFTTVPAIGSCPPVAAPGRRILATSTLATTCSTPPATATSITTATGTGSFNPRLRLDIAGVPPVVTSPWETNDAACDLNLDGIQNTGTGPIHVDKCTNTYLRVNINSTLVGNLWDIGFHSGGGVSPPSGCSLGTGGTFTAGGQRVNLNVLAPDLAFLNNFFSFALPPAACNIFSPCYFPGSFTVPAISPVAVPLFCGQMGIANPAHVDGFSLSALCETRWVDPVPLGAPVTLPDNDDDITTVIPVGCFPFYNAGYTNMTVSTNARVLFGSTGVTANWQGTTALALTEAPEVGAWTDLSPNLAAATADITVSSVGSVYQIVYTDCPYFGIATATNSFTMMLDSSNGGITISGLAFDAGGPQQFLGVSRGNTGATNGGAIPGGYAAFIGGSFIPANATDMIYESGLAGTLAPGVTSITFTPIQVGGSPADGNYMVSVL